MLLSFSRSGERTRRKENFSARREIAFTAQRAELICPAAENESGGNACAAILLTSSPATKILHPRNVAAVANFIPTVCPPSPSLFPFPWSAFDTLVIFFLSPNFLGYNSRGRCSFCRAIQVHFSGCFHRSRGTEIRPREEDSSA